MKAEKLREQSDQELKQLIEDTSKELFDLRVKQSSGAEVSGLMKMKGLRRDLARIKTILHERKTARPAVEEAGK